MIFAGNATQATAPKPGGNARHWPFDAKMRRFPQRKAARERQNFRRFFSIQTVLRLLFDQIPSRIHQDCKPLSFQ
jgi:hypothetical protein